MKNILLLIATGFAAFASTLFVFAYHILAAWWKKVWGRQQMVLIGSLAATFDLAFLFMLIGTPTWAVWLAVGLYTAIGVSVLWLLGILVHSQRGR